jgi:hypothetical protein
MTSDCVITPPSSCEKANPSVAEFMGFEEEKKLENFLDIVWGCSTGTPLYFVYLVDFVSLVEMNQHRKNSKKKNQTQMKKKLKKKSLI